MFRVYNDLAPYNENAMNVLKENPSDPNAQMVVFYYDKACRAARFNRKQEFESFRQLVIGKSA